MKYSSYHAGFVDVRASGMLVIGASSNRSVREATTGCAPVLRAAYFPRNRTTPDVYRRME